MLQFTKLTNKPTIRNVYIQGHFVNSTRLFSLDFFLRLVNHRFHSSAISFKTSCSQYHIHISQEMTQIVISILKRNLTVFIISKFKAIFPIILKNCKILKCLKIDALFYAVLCVNIFPFHWQGLCKKMNNSIILKVNILLIFQLSSG